MAYAASLMTSTEVSAALPGQGSRLPPTFRALRHRNYRLWFFGQGVSLIGTWMQTMAQQVLIYRLTGSAAALGVISAIGLIPLMPLALWGGSIADRAPKRTIILIAQTVMMIQAFVLAALAWTGAVQVWQVYALAFVLAAAQAVDLPARQAFTVEMVEGKEDLTNAIGLNSAMFNGARAHGSGAGGDARGGGGRRAGLPPECAEFWGRDHQPAADARPAGAEQVCAAAPVSRATWRKGSGSSFTSGRSWC